MADENDGGEKTEEPSPKRLQDARKKGQVAKSKDLTRTAELLTWFLLALLAWPWAASQTRALMNTLFVSLQQPFAVAAPTLASQASHTLLAISAAVLVPMALVGVLLEFLQAGPVFTTERLQPKFENMNPVEGIKRMFGKDNLMEVVKSLIKTSILLLLGVLVVMPLLIPLAQLPWSGQPLAVGNALWAASKPMLAWVSALFVVLSAIDFFYQRWSHLKKLRMSRHDIKQEAKEQAGDPLIKSQRRQAHEEWSQRNSSHAAAQASVLVVNPTHVAIAINYDRELFPVPTIAAKGEDEVARAMRQAAEDAGVPIVRNVSLARELLAQAEVDEIVPSDFFDIVAEVILWAQEVRDEMDRVQQPTASAPNAGSRQRRAPPGEDLTRYAGLASPLQQDLSSASESREQRSI